MTDLTEAIRDKLGKINHCKLQLLTSEEGNAIGINEPTISYPRGISKECESGFSYIKTKPNELSFSIYSCPSISDVFYFEMNERFVTERENELLKVLKNAIKK